MFSGDDDMNTVSSIARGRRCTGCLACIQACPVGCIGIQEDPEGFQRPEIQENACIRCGKRLASCHVAQPGLFQAVLETRVLKSKNLTSFRLGSSGGIFGTLCDLLAKEGFVVYGAAFDEVFCLKCVRADDCDDHKSLLGSKYVQSDMTDAYKLVLDDIDNGRQVLFCGTPCQVAALIRFLGRRPGNLLTIDLVCHGVPSPAFWKIHLNYLRNKLGGEIREVRFRRKTYSDKAGYALNVWTQNRHWVLPHKDDVYYSTFLEGVSLRECCYECGYACRHRVGDLTIGDCGTLSSYRIFAKEGLGTIVLANSAKGCMALRLLEPFTIGMSLDFEKEVAANAQLRQPVARPQIRDFFYCDLRELPYDEFRKKYLRPVSCSERIKDFIKGCLPWRILELCKRIKKSLI